MTKQRITLIVLACLTVVVVPIAGFFAVNGAELKEAMKIDKSSGKLLYLYVPC